MKEFQLPEGVDAAEQARAFAKSLHDAWGVGSATCNNGVLLLMALDNRQVYISTGATTRPCSRPLLLGHNPGLNPMHALATA